MANVKFTKKEFEEHIKLNEKVIEKISLFGTPLEKITDNEIEIEIPPNRPDLLSMQGYLRAFKSFLGKSPGMPKYKLNKPEADYKVTIQNSVKSIRPYTTCAIVKNLSLNEEKIKEIIDIQEKLHSTLGRKRKKMAIGIYPLEKIKLPITYTALDSEKIKFIPLDYDKPLTAKQILQKHPKGKEYAHLLKDQIKFPVFIDANKKVLSMPPIINSHDTGKISEKTKSVFIECSGFSLDVLNKTLNIIVTTLSDLGGKIFQMYLEYDKKIKTPSLDPEKIPLSLENTNRLLGLELKESDLQKLLSKMQLTYKNKSVFVPAWRTDILHEVDIIEDIAIAYGYDNLIPEMPNVSTTGQEDPKSKIKSKISEILIGLGLLETSSYHLVKNDEIEKLNTPDAVELKDSKTEYKILRPNLLIPTLRILTENKDHEYPQKIFELGVVFSKDEDNKLESGVTETDNLIISLSPGNFTGIKQTLDYLAKTLNIQFKLEETTKKELIPGRTTSILLNNKTIGYLGEIHPKTLHSWNIKMPLSVLEISLEEIYNLLKDN